MEYTITEFPAQKFLVVKRNFTDSQQVPSFWDECSESGRLGELCLRRPNGIRDLYGLCRKLNDTEFEYGIGIVLDVATNWMHQAEMHVKGITQWDVPAGTYLALNCIGEDASAVAAAWKWFYEEFLPNTEYNASDKTDIEIYPDVEKDGVFCKLLIPIEHK